MVKAAELANERTWQDPNTGSVMIVSQEEYEFLEDEHMGKFRHAGMTDQQLYDRTKFIESRERDLDDILERIESEKRAIVGIQRDVSGRENMLAAREAGLGQVELDLRHKLDVFRVANAKILTAIDDAIAMMEVEEPAEALAALKAMQEKLDIKW